jgi:hypothetical protein
VTGHADSGIQRAGGRVERVPVVLTQAGAVAAALVRENVGLIARVSRVEVDAVVRAGPRVLSSSVAADAGDWVELPLASCGRVQLDLSNRVGAHAAVAGIAIFIEHVDAMDDVEIGGPVPSARRRDVVVAVKLAMAFGTGPARADVRRVELVRRRIDGPEGSEKCGHHPDRGSSAKRSENSY